MRFIRIKCNDLYQIDEKAEMSTVSSDIDFKSTFSLLPQVLKIVRALQITQTDPQKQQVQLQAAVSELNAKLQACHQMLVSYPCLDQSPKEQTEMLESKKKQLEEKCEQILMYKDLEVLHLSSEAT